MQSIKARLAVSFFCIILLLLIQGIFAYRNIKTISRIQTQSHQQISQINTISLKLANTRLLVYKMLGTMNPADMDLIREQIRLEEAWIEKALSKKAEYTLLVRDNFQIYEKIISLQYDFSVRTARNLMNSESKQLHEQLVSKLKALSGQIRKTSENQVKQTYSQTIRITLGLLVLALFIALLLAFILARTLIDRHQAQVELEESEKKYRTLVNTLPYGIQVSDTEGRIVFSNPAHNRIHGYPDGGMPGQFVWDPISEEPMKEKTKEYYRDIIENRPEPEIYFTRDTTRDGREIHVQVNWDYIKSARGDLEGVISIITDITEQKQAEQALQASHKRFLTVLESIDATIYVADMETYEILFMNRHMIKQFGRDMTGEICWDVFRGEKQVCSHCTNERLVDAQGNPKGVCVWQDRNPVTGRWYINHDRAIEWTDDRLVRLQIATDVTNLKNMEEELRQSHKMEAIGTLAGGIAHDFNNILGIIIGNTELAIDDIAQWNPARTCLEEIKTASMRAKDVVRQLLSFSRKSEQEQIVLDISPIISESVQLLRASIPTTVEMVTHIKKDLSPIKADPTQIQQVLINLCTNAAQAMEEKGGRITISLRGVQKSLDNVLGAKKRPFIRLDVSDTGEGVPSEIQNRVFDPYFTTKGVGKGSGMGLAIVHGIVMNHSGEIYLNSDPGRGTQIILFFPVCDETRETAAVKEQIADVPHGSEYVLIVDDEPALANMSKLMLEKLGYRVEAQTDPVKAFEMFTTADPAVDLVITDMTMPGMTGAALCEKIKQEQPDTPVIICTGHSSLINEEKAKRIGVDALVMKPLEMRKLATTIRRVIAAKKNRSLNQA